MSWKYQLIKHISPWRLAVLLTLVIGFSSCSILRWHYLKKSGGAYPTVKNNVCKSLRGNVVIYAVFVDSKYTGEWTTFDIKSTLDSIETAATWLEEQAAASGASLNIKVDYHVDEDGVVPLEENLSRKTLSNTVLSSGGIRNTDKWADKLSAKALQLFGPDTSTITKNKLKPKDREKLIARIRDKHKTESVALMFFINNSFTDEISVTLHIAEDDQPEYSVVSYKYSNVIAHEFLHLFGAIDMYVNPIYNNVFLMRRMSKAMGEFPDEIMAHPYRNLSKLEISPVTKYLIGWESKLDKKYNKFLGIGNYNTLEY